MVGVGGEKLVGKGGGEADGQARDLGVEVEAQASGSDQGKTNIGCLSCFSCVCGYYVRVFQCGDVEFIEGKRQELSLGRSEGCPKSGGYSALSHHINLRAVQTESHNA